MFILGVDGGGTRTRLELRDMDNTFLRREELGAFNLSAIGEEAFVLQVREIARVCGGMAECAALCVGGAGTAGSPAGELLRRELEAAGFAGRLLLLGDHEIALAGAMNGPGCVLISGTGSICCGRNAAGELARAGGYGHLIDDGGSGYALGRDALAAAVSTEDGRQEDITLRDAVMRELGVGDAEGLVRLVYYGGRSKQTVAALAPVVIRCAGEGDEVSLGVLRRGAEELCALAAAVALRLGLERPDVALLGGLLEHGGLYRGMVEEVLAETARIVQPLHDPLWGAAQLAWECLE